MEGTWEGYGDILNRLLKGVVLRLIKGGGAGDKGE